MGFIAFAANPVELSVTTLTSLLFSFLFTRLHNAALKLSGSSARIYLFFALTFLFFFIINFVLFMIFFFKLEDIRRFFLSPKKIFIIVVLMLLFLTVVHCCINTQPWYSDSSLLLLGFSFRFHYSFCFYLQ